MKRFREFHDKSIVHSEGPDGCDYTLCGLALEGENGDEPMEETRDRIRCPGCIATINFCKSIKASEINRR